LTTEFIYNIIYIMPRRVKMKKYLYILACIILFTQSSFAATQLLLLGPGQSISPGAGNGRVGGSETTSQQTAGTYFWVTVCACDSSWNIDTAATGSVSMGSSDILASFSPVSQGFTNGKAYFMVTLFKTASGSQTITATHSGAYAPDIDTIPLQSGIFDHFDFTTPITNKTAGALITYSAVAHDAYNNTVTGFSNAVNIDVIAGGVPVDNNHMGKFPGSPLFSSGILTSAAVRVYKTAANAVLRLSYGGISINNSNTFSISQGAAARLVIVAPGETLDQGNFSTGGKSGAPATQAAGTSLPVTVYVTDNYGNWITTNTDTIAINSSDAAGTANSSPLPAQIVLASGTGTFNFIFENSGTQSITCSDTTNGAISDGIDSLPVNAGPVSSFEIAGITSPQTAGTSCSPVIKARDAYGNIATNFTGSVWVTSPDTDWTLPSETTISVTVTSTNTAADLVQGYKWHVTFTAADNGAKSLTLNFHRAVPSARLFVSDNENDTPQSHTGIVAQGLPVAINYGELDRLQVLPPGMEARPGTSAGRNLAPAPQAQGAAFAVTINACDAWWNVISGSGAQGSNDTIQLISNDNYNTMASWNGQAYAQPPVYAYLQNGTTTTNISYSVVTPNFNITAGDATTGGVAGDTSPYINISSPGGPVIYAPGRFSITAPGGGPIGAQQAGTPFVISITAYTDNTQSIVDTGFNGVKTALKASNNYSDSEYCLSPAQSVTFTAGVAVMPVTMYRASVTWSGGGVTVYLAYGAETSLSNTFSLKWGTVASSMLLVQGMEHMPGLKQAGLPGYSGYTGSPITEQAGNPFQAEVLYVDNNYNIVYDYPVSYCRISSSDAAASLDGLSLNSANVYVTVTAGVFMTNAFILRTTGSNAFQTITASPGGVLPDNTTMPISIMHAAQDHFGVSAPPGTRTAGASFPVTVCALDAYQNICDNRNGGIPFSDTVSLSPSTGYNTMYPYNVILGNGQAVLYASLYKAPEIGVNISAFTSMYVSGTSQDFNTASDSFSRLLVFEPAGMNMENGRYAGNTPGVFPMASGAPFSNIPGATTVSYLSGSSHLAAVHTFVIYACDAYGNVTSTPDLAGQTVSVWTNDAYAAPVTKTALDPVTGRCFVDMVFHTAGQGVSVSAHTTFGGAADFTTNTFTTLAGPAYGMQLLSTGLSVVEGSGNTIVPSGNWYNGVTGTPAAHVSGEYFPVTIQACDIFGNFVPNNYDRVSLTAGGLTDAGGSFPEPADIFAGYLGDSAPGRLTLTANMNVNISQYIQLVPGDLVPGPWNLNRTLDIIPQFYISSGPLPTFTATYAATGTATITATGTAPNGTCTITPTITSTCTETEQAATATPTATASATGPVLSMPAQGTAYAYPQPAKGTINFVYFLDEQSDITIRVYDISGALKASVKDTGRAMALNATTMDTSKLPSGLYFYSVSAKARGGNKLNFPAGKLVILK
jgi:hypothetical protein